MRVVLATLMLVAVACSSAPPQPTPRAVASPSPAPTPIRLKAPPEAILEDAQIGLPRTAARDHLTAAEAASFAADQPLALQTYTSWGWVEESTRTWSGGDRSADALVLLTLRPAGARLAFVYYAQATDVAPYSSASCPAAITGLDGCHMGTTGARAVITGWLSEEVFVIGGSGVDVGALAALQAGRLRA